MMTMDSSFTTKTKSWRVPVFLRFRWSSLEVSSSRCLDLWLLKIITVITNFCSRHLSPLRHRLLSAVQKFSESDRCFTYRKRGIERFLDQPITYLSIFLSLNCVDRNTFVYETDYVAEDAVSAWLDLCGYTHLQVDFSRKKLGHA